MQSDNRPAKPEGYNLIPLLDTNNILYTRNRRSEEILSTLCNDTAFELPLLRHAGIVEPRHVDKIRLIIIFGPLTDDRIKPRLWPAVPGLPGRERCFVGPF